MEKPGMLTAKAKANQSGSEENKDSLHAQRIEGETGNSEYNPSTSHRHPNWVKRYAELIRKNKKLGIKSLSDNKMLLQPQQRFQDTSTAEGGFQSLMFNGLPVVPDSHAPSQKFYFLNEDYIHLFAHKEEDMRFEPFAKPVNQNVKIAKIYWMGAYGTSNARLQGGFTALTG